LTPDQALATLRKYREIGIDQPIVNMPFVEKPETIEFVADAILRAVAGW